MRFVFSFFLSVLLN